MRTSLGRIFREGLFGGIVAYLAVVVVFAALNLIEGHSLFHTAAAMGAVLLHGADASAHFAVEARPVLVWNGLHLIGSIAVGIFAAFQLFETERHRAIWYVPFTVLIAAVVYAVTMMGVFGVEIGGVVEWSAVLIGTAAWIGSMTAYFLFVHRALLREIRDELEAEA